MRPLNEYEQTIVRLAKEKYGSSERDELFFLEDGSAVLQVWANNGDGPWIHVTNVSGFLRDNLMEEVELQQTQM